VDDEKSVDFQRLHNGWDNLPSFHSDDDGRNDGPGDKGIDDEPS
jgi:hypothetical protein